MRTTVDLDRALLERAKEALGTATFREAIIRALEEAVSRAEMVRLMDRLEGSDATWDLNALLSYRRLEHGHGP
jgi:Arc/MetJ family transcription regulator